jgi:tripartite motif-containing protein 71
MSDLSLQELEKQLICSVCLDRYKNPKLLPCQHTFCAQPCLKNIADLYLKRLKCPECRIIHQLTNQGIEALPNNLTIVGFLDLYNQKSMENSSDRCSECSQKRDNITKCLECAKYFCSNCKLNHLMQIKSEIQENVPILRRVLPKLSEKVGTKES